jgi:hypothetical protein
LAPFDPDLRPKGASLRLLIGKPAFGGHPDPASGQTPVFSRAAEEFDGRCASSQVNTLPNAKSQAKDKRAKDRQKYAAPSPLADSRSIIDLEKRAPRITKIWIHKMNT